MPGHFTIKFGQKWNRQTTQKSLSANQAPIITRQEEITTQVHNVTEAEGHNTGSLIISERVFFFYSTLFLVKKKTGDLCPVLDLKNLDKRIQIKVFKMESLQSILLAINLGDWMLSIDLSDTYLHVPIHPPFLS